MKLLASLVVLTAARKAQKKFESAKEMILDAPAIESSKDLPRTVNGTGHTGPSEFCATSI
jgi:hypothetical protein